MNLFKNLLSLVGLILSFVFLPGDAWINWFSDEDKRYGELQLIGNGVEIVVAKNLTQGPVALQDGPVLSHLSIALGSGLTKDKGTEPHIPKGTVSVLQSEPALQKPTLRVGNDSSLFEPADLVLLVPAELDQWALKLLAISMFFLALGASCAFYFREGAIAQMSNRNRM